MRASIVINTYNRCASLTRTLASLRQLRYRNFEVVVVNGPSEDDTDALLAGWRDSIKLQRCPTANLSASRNIGIAAAAGDIVAFIDDDSIPDPQWLGNIIAGYDSEEIGGVGGFVYDSTGYDLQTGYIVCDRFGGATTDHPSDPTALFNAPGAPRYAAHLGTNTSFRRALLLDLGGFDEEFAYYLDETDVCLRVVDSGHVIKFVDDAFVYHKFGASHLRNERKTLVTRYEILRSQAYFAFKHGAPASGHLEAMQAIIRFVARHREEVAWCVSTGRLPATATAFFESEQRRAMRDGLEREIKGAGKYLARETLAAHAAAFKPFDREQVAEDRLTLCLFTRQYPPGPTDGIGRSVYELAQALADLGHMVHVLTASETHNRVDLEDGIWVHRLTITEHPAPALDIPAHIWNYSRSMMDEIDRIHALDRVDVIEAPAWDCEGIAALFDGRIPVVTSLHTPMMVAASMHPQWLIDSDAVQKVVVPLIRCERMTMMFSDGLAANTAGIIDTIEQSYDVAFDRSRTSVVSRGMRDRALPSPTSMARDEVRVLFIGRLEYRKGIDLLIGALLELLPEHPNLRADIIGEDAARDPEPGFAQRFASAAGRAPWASHVRFHGRVDQSLLDNYLAACDIFVAPSRFESFGLIYLEAMMFGKPVIAGDAGGIGEVVAQEESGLLVASGDQDALTAALHRLIGSRELRERLGSAGRRRYLGVFPARAMAERAIALYKRVVAQPSRARQPQRAAAGPIDLTRRCDLSEFWLSAPLHPRLSAIGKEVIDRRLWAYCLALEALRQSHPGTPRDGKPQALIIADHPMPNAQANAPGWQIAALSMVANAPFHGSSIAQAYNTGRFDLVACLIVLDPLADSFGPAVEELARLCTLGGALHIVIATGAAVARRAPLVADMIARAGLRTAPDVAAFLQHGPGDCAFCDARIEPFLGISLQGEGRPVAALALERTTSSHNVAQRLSAAAAVVAR